LYRKILELYDEHAKRCDPGDLLRQVRKTVGGQPVDDRQVEMIVESVLRYLDLDRDDVLLDLCCGNGFLTDRIFEHCVGGLGVDVGPYLIDVAKANFERRPDRIYVVDDVEHFVLSAEETSAFTKALCYGAFMYLSDEASLAVLGGIRDRFPNVTRVVLGNLPDRARLHDFFYAEAYQEGIENDHEATTGRWRDESEIGAIAAAAGWRSEISRMSPPFFAAHYRYDVILTPA
jgi:SAM-dependent methyltransferase